MQFCPIAPVSYLDKLPIDRYKTHLLLAHLVESSPEYVKYYNKISHHRDEFTGTRKEKTIILDNSAYEMHRAGLPMFEPSKLVELGKKVHADYVVLSDYPGEPGKKTIEAAEKLIPEFQHAKLGTFFVPQSRIGDLEDYIATFAWAASHPGVDYIGISVLGVPNAFGVEGNPLHGVLARPRMMDILYSRGLLQLAKSNGKKIHWVGMSDGPYEIRLMQGYIAAEYIQSWDTSSPVWAGISDIKYDMSPTGLINGKVKTHVDFDIDFDETKVPAIAANLSYINDLMETYSRNAT